MDYITETMTALRKDVEKMQFLTADQPKPTDYMFREQFRKVYLLRPELKKAILERCKTTDIVSDGIVCTHCGADEAYKAADDPTDVDRWVFVIRAFRVDDASECRNCEQWFVC